MSYMLRQEEGTTVAAPSYWSPSAHVTMNNGAVRDCILVETATGAELAHVYGVKAKGKNFRLYFQPIGADPPVVRIFSHRKGPGRSVSSVTDLDAYVYAPTTDWSEVFALDAVAAFSDARALYNYGADMYATAAYASIMLKTTIASRMPGWPIPTGPAGVFHPEWLTSTGPVIPNMDYYIVCPLTQSLLMALPDGQVVQAPVGMETSEARWRFTITPGTMGIPTYYIWSSWYDYNLCVGPGGVVDARTTVNEWEKFSLVQPPSQYEGLWQITTQKPPNYHNAFLPWRTLEFAANTNAVTGALMTFTPTMGQVFQVRLAFAEEANTP